RCGGPHHRFVRVLAFGHQPGCGDEAENVGRWICASRGGPEDGGEDDRHDQRNVSPRQNEGRHAESMVTRFRAPRGDRRRWVRAACGHDRRWAGLSVRHRHVPAMGRAHGRRGTSGVLRSVAVRGLPAGPAIGAKRGTWRPLLLTVAAAAVTAVLAFAPFVPTPEKIAALVRDATSPHPFSSLFAFNIWALATGFAVPDETPILGIPIRL